MGFLTKAGLQRETGRSRDEVDRLLRRGLPHEVVGGRSGEVRIDRQRAMAWLAGAALAAGDGPDAAAPATVRERIRLVKEQADGQALKNAVARGELLPAGDVVAGWQPRPIRVPISGAFSPSSACITIRARRTRPAPTVRERAIRPSASLSSSLTTRTRRVMAGLRLRSA